MSALRQRSPFLASESLNVLSASSVYVPRWVELKGSDGKRFGSAIAFTIDTTHPQYGGHLDQDTVVDRLATASGGLGSASDHLVRTCEGLCANGIPLRAGVPCRLGAMHSGR